MFVQNKRTKYKGCWLLLCILSVPHTHTFYTGSIIVYELSTHTLHSENRIRPNINMYSQMLPLTVMNPVEFVSLHEDTSHWLWDRRPEQAPVHMLQQTIVLALEMVLGLVPAIDFVVERLLNKFLFLSFNFVFFCHMNSFVVYGVRIVRSHQHNPNGVLHSTSILPVDLHVEWTTSIGL